MRPLTLWLLLTMPVVADELVVVTRDMCPPCRQLKRDLLRHPDVARGHTIRLLEGRAAMEAWNVDRVPTIIRIRAGREIARRVGHDGIEQLKEWLR